jgi:hypothetical protein
VSQETPEGQDRRSTHLYFLDEDPRDCFDLFATHQQALADSGLGEVSYVAPFVPTIPGTDTYCDQLW